MPFWKPTPKITVAEHERIAAAKEHLIQKLFGECGLHQRNLNDMGRELAKAKQDAHVMSLELAHWKKYGQLRDPATGRLIPKNAGKTPVGGE